jgi:hypothetical protein
MPFFRRKRTVMERYTFDQAWEVQGGRFTLDDEFLRREASHILSKVPKEVADRVVRECLLLGTGGGENAFHIPSRLIEGMDLIVVSPLLFEKDRAHIEFVILHEIAHFWLGHDPDPGLEVVDEGYYANQEEAADALVREWLETV